MHIPLLRSFALVVLFLTLAGTAGAQSIAINEVLSSNDNTNVDDEGDYQDWVELYNFGDEPVDLTGFGLSDDWENPYKWTFPSGTIEPGEFLIVWASNKDRVSDGVYHTNFAISAGGEEIVLWAPGGEAPLDSFPPTPLLADQSMGRVPDGTGDWRLFDTPTPGASNGEGGVIGRLTPPSFSQTGGFYTSSLSLTLSNDDTENVRIYYTLDGSEPDEESALYEGPIQIDSRPNNDAILARKSTTRNYGGYHGPVFMATTVRAMAVREGYLPSKAVTHTYFVDPSIDSRYQLPIVSLTFDPDSLFDYDRGIYVPGAEYDRYPDKETREPAPGNFHLRGREWERPVHVEFFEPDGTRGFAMNAGTRIHGGWSRSHRMKSLRLYFRSDYDEVNAVEYPLFSEKPDVRHKRLILRNSGNDFGYTMLRDAFMTRLVNHLDLEYMAYRPSVVFLNGEFWGIHNIRERFDDRYLEGNYGVDPAAIDLLEANATADEGSNEHYRAMLEFIRSNGTETDEAYAHIRTQMDVDNFIDYYLSQIYFANTDWPQNNIKFWRKQVDYDPSQPRGHDGRWRWMLYDTDFGFDLYGGRPANHNTLRWVLDSEHHNPWESNPWSTELFRRLLENEDFKKSFVNRFADQLNTSFRPDRVLSILDETADAIRPAYDESRERWAFGQSFDYHLNPMRAFGENRVGHMRTQLNDAFSLGGSRSLTVDVSDPSAGYVRVNSVDLLPSTPGVDEDPYPWSGTYFRSVPVTLTARPAPGYRFVEWAGIDGVAGSVVSLELNRDRTVTAVFEPYDGPVPSAHSLSSGTYSMTSWSPDEAAGTYPPHMAFFQSRVVDPVLDDDAPDLYPFAYDLTSATRVLGLGDEGFAFINTGTTNNLVEGAEGRGLGAAVLALNTQNAKDIQVSWRGRTIRPNEREYAVRLQYRVGDEGEFNDVTGQDGGVIEYRRSTTEGHQQSFGPITLPADAEGQDYVQLRWKYHYTGPVESGPRSMLAVDDIVVAATISISTDEPITLPTFRLEEPYPNPVSGSVNLAVNVPAAGDVVLEVFDVLGRRVATVIDDVLPAGRHALQWDSRSLASGVYIVRAHAGGLTQTRRLVVVK